MCEGSGALRNDKLMKTLVLIPARGGSKGIPGKNIKEFAGLPLICHSIRVAKELFAAEDICVSTDSEKIANCARAEGLEVPFMRPAELASDTAGSREVILHALDFYKSRGVDYDSVLLLQPTSPLRNVGDVRKCLEVYTDDVDMVVTVKESGSNPYYNCFETTADGYLHISKGDGLYTRRQDAPKAWEFNGAVYVINAESLRRMPMGLFPRRVPVEMPIERSLDLDTPLDWIIAEQMYDMLYDDK